MGFCPSGVLSDGVLCEWGYVQWGFVCLPNGHKQTWGQIHLNVFKYKYF